MICVFLETSQVRTSSKANKNLYVGFTRIKLFLFCFAVCAVFGQEGPCSCLCSEFILKGKKKKPIYLKKFNAGSVPH